MCGKQFRHRLIVLSREDFSRDHQRALIPIFADRQECQDRDDRLAGTNVSLDQAVHDGAALKSPSTSSRVLSWAFVSLYGRSSGVFCILPAFYMKRAPDVLAFFL